MQMQVHGVSTRKIEKAAAALCGHGFSAAAISRINAKLDADLKRFEERLPEGPFPYLILNARYEKVREDGVVRDRAVLIAFGGPADAALVSEGLNTISNVYSIEMDPPVDSSGNGSVDLHSVISGLAELGCGAGTSNSFISGTLMIDCADVRFAGNAEVGADLAVGGDLEVDGGINAGSVIEAKGGVSALRFVAGAIDDEDLTEGVYFSDVVRMGQGPEIAKPVCEAENVEPQVYAFRPRSAVRTGFRLSACGPARLKAATDPSD